MSPGLWMFASAGMISQQRAERLETWVTHLFKLDKPDICDETEIVYKGVKYVHRRQIQQPGQGNMHGPAVTHDDNCSLFCRSECFVHRTLTLEPRDAQRSVDGGSEPLHVAADG